MNLCISHIHENPEKEEEGKEGEGRKAEITVTLGAGLSDVWNPEIRAEKIFLANERNWMTISDAVSHAYHP